MAYVAFPVLRQWLRQFGLCRGKPGVVLTGLTNKLVYTHTHHIYIYIDIYINLYMNEHTLIY